MVTGCAERAATGARNRLVVPDIRASINVPGSTATAPPVPPIRTSASSGRQLTSAPSDLTPSIMASVSSARSAPVSVVSPVASAAHTSARLVMLLEPGSLTVASGGAPSGVMVRTLGQCSITRAG